MKNGNTKTFFKLTFGLKERIIFFVLFIILIFIIVLSTIYKTQQERILKDSYEREISPYLLPVQNLVSEIDYYINLFIQLEEFRIRNKKELINYIDNLKKEKENIDKKNILKLQKEDFLDPYKKEIYQNTKENLLNQFNKIIGKQISNTEIESIFQYASILANAKIENNEKNFINYRVKYDYLMQDIFSYQEKQKNLFQGLNFNQFRIESINPLRWQRFDTKNLSIAREQSPINKISWQDPDVKIPLDIIYNKYKNNEPLIESYSTQFVNNQIPYLLIVKTIYQYPEIYERSIRILKSLESKDKYQWKLLIGKLDSINRNIARTYEKVKNKEEVQDKNTLYKDEEYRILLDTLKKLIRQKKEVIEELSYNYLKKYNNHFAEYINKKREISTKIKVKQKELLQYSLENTDARVNIIKEINKLKNELSQIEKEKNNWNFDSHLELIDSYLYLIDNIIYRKIFFEYNYDPNRYTDYVKSPLVQEFYKNLFIDIEDWIFSPFSRSFEKYKNRGFVILDQKSAREIFIQIHTQSLDELAENSLIENTAGFTRIITDMRNFLQETSLEKSLFIDTAIALGIRILIISILFSGILVQKVQFIIKQILKIGEGNLNIFIPFRGKDEISQLAYSVNKMVKELKEKEELKKELNAAEEIQKRLLPKSYPSNMQNHLEIASFYKAMMGVGGDYYDFIEASSSEMVFCIADVSSHGVGPALIMTLLRSRLHSIVKQGITDPLKIAWELNQDLYNETPPEIFITAFIGSYNKETNILRFISSGHPPAILIRNYKINILPGGGLPLAAVHNTLYKDIVKSQRVQLNAGDIFIQYTDGLTEAMNEQNELFGIERLEKLLLENINKKPEDMIYTIISKIEEFSKKKILTKTEFSELNDDIAILIFRKI